MSFHAESPLACTKTPISYKVVDNTRLLPKQTTIWDGIGGERSPLRTSVCYRFLIDVSVPFAERILTFRI